MSCEPIWSNIPSMTIHIRRCFHVNLNGLVCQFGQSLLHRLKCMWPQFIFGLHENRCSICVHSTMDKWKLWLVASNTHTHTDTAYDSGVRITGVYAFKMHVEECERAGDMWLPVVLIVNGLAMSRTHVVGGQSRIFKSEKQETTDTLKQNSVQQKQCVYTKCL